MEMPKLKVKKLREDAVLPRYHFDGDAGLDLFSCEDVTIAPGERARVPTGIAVSIPKGYAGLIWDKSGLSIGHGIKVLGGVIDAGYRGEILMGLANLSSEPYTIGKGHKAAQMLIQKIERLPIEEVSELDETLRGEGGFGSTGK